MVINFGLPCVYTRNASENKDNKKYNEIRGQYTIRWSKGELSVVFGSGGNKKHKYSCNNTVPMTTSLTCLIWPE